VVGRDADGVLELLSLLLKSLLAVVVHWRVISGE
jgi:hypothetical protein